MRFKCRGRVSYLCPFNIRLADERFVELSFGSCARRWSPIIARCLTGLRFDYRAPKWRLCSLTGIYLSMAADMRTYSTFASQLVRKNSLVFYRVFLSVSESILIDFVYTLTGGNCCHFLNKNCTKVVFNY